MRLSNVKSKAIMKTDIKGFSTHVGLLNDLELSKLLKKHKEFIQKKTKDYKGSIIKGEGDSFWITFNSITAAVKSAMEIQNELRESNISSLNSSRLAIRISITIGDILLQDDDIFGEAVNLCARIESITPHDEIYISNAAYLTLMKKNIKTDLVGKFSFKGFKDKEVVYKVNLQYKSTIIKNVFCMLTDINRFIQIFNNVEFFEKSYDALLRIVNESIDRYDVSLIHNIGDEFVLSSADSKNIVNAALYILKNWNDYLSENNLDNYIRIGIHQGTIKVYRDFVAGKGLSGAYFLEHSSKNLRNNKRNIIAISDRVIDALKSNIIKKKFKKVSNKNIDERLIERGVKTVYTHEI